MKLENSELWENLTISNDFIFSKVMRDKEICKETLEYVETEQPNENDFVKKLENKIKRVKENKEWRVEYMKSLLREQENS